VSFAGDLSGFIDEELEKLGRKRHVVLAVPQFNGLSTLLAGTDIVATVPDYTADALTAAGGVRAEDPPLPTRTFELHMAWRGSQDNDPGSAGCGRGFRCSSATLTVFRVTACHQLAAKHGVAFNIALFDELQSHDLLDATPEGEAVGSVL
jgi:hypothetical protein